MEQIIEDTTLCEVLYLFDQRHLQVPRSLNFLRVKIFINLTVSLDKIFVDCRITVLNCSIGQIFRG